jgi:hypothetical protein
LRAQAEQSVPEKWKHPSFFSSISPPAAMVWVLKRERTVPSGNIAPHGSSVEVVLALVAAVWLLEIESVALLGLYDNYLGITVAWIVGLLVLRSHLNVKLDSGR